MNKKTNLPVIYIHCKVFESIWQIQILC